MGTSWVAVSINNIKTRASSELTSRKNIKIFDFNGVNVAKHWHVVGRGICHLWLPCYTLGYCGLVAEDSPQHAHPSRLQILHRSGEKKISVLDCFHIRKADLYGWDDSWEVNWAKSGYWEPPQIATEVHILDLPAGWKRSFSNLELYVIFSSCQLWN